LLQGDDSFSITHPFSGFRFCVIIHVSAPKPISVTCPMDIRKAHTVPFNELCYHLWDSSAPSVHTLLCNPVGHRQFCALPSECLAPWQRQQLNVSVRQVSSVVDMLGAQVTNWQHLSYCCWKPCTVSACFHGLTHTPYNLINWQCIFTGATHITHKKQNTLHTSKSAMVLEDHPYLIWHTVPTHNCTMIQSACADCMLKSAVPWYYFMSDMLLLYFLKLPCVPVRGRKLKIWYKNTATRGSTTGMKKDMPLIPNNNDAVGVTWTATSSHTQQYDVIWMC